MKIVDCGAYSGGKDLYIMTCKRASAFKVGVSKDCLRRWATISTSCPGEVTLDYVFKGGEVLEDAIHLLLKGRGYHVHGEWFELTAYEQAVEDIACLVSDLTGVWTPLEVV
jgi:hypothetical protein